MAPLEKSAGFLRGLLEGMELDADAPQSKLLRGIVDLLGDLCSHAKSMEEMLGELNEYVEDIDDDLARLEGEEGDGGEDFAFDDEDDYDDMPFGGEEHLRLLSRDRDDGQENAMKGGVCPECKGIAFIARDDSLEERYVCPHCGKAVKLQPLSEGNAPIARPAGE